MEIQDIDTLCASLQRYDPDTTEVSYRFHRYRDAERHYRRIGKALLGDGGRTRNTHVSLICLKLNRFFDAKDRYGERHRPQDTEENVLFLRGTACAGPMLRYVRCCVADDTGMASSLRKLDLSSEERGWGDESDCWIRVTARLAGLFFQAMMYRNLDQQQQGNPIDELIVGRWSLMEIESFGAMLRTTQSLRKLTVVVRNDVSNSARLAQALESNQSLERLSLLADEDETEEVEHAPNVIENVLLSVHSHPSMQEIVIKCSCDMSMSTESAEAYSLILSSTHSLRRLELEYKTIDGESMRLFVEGLRSNRGTLETLHLGVRGPSEPGAVPTFVEYFESLPTPAAMSSASTSNLTELRYYGSGLVPLLQSMILSGSVGSRLHSLAVGAHCPENTEWSGEHDVVGLLDCFSVQDAKIRLHSLDLRVDGAESAQAVLQCLPKLVFLRD